MRKLKHVFNAGGKRQQKRHIKDTEAGANVGRKAPEEAGGDGKRTEEKSAL